MLCGAMFQSIRLTAGNQVVIIFYFIDMTWESLYLTVYLETNFILTSQGRLDLIHMVVEERVSTLPGYTVVMGSTGLRVLTWKSVREKQYVVAFYNLTVCHAGISF
jgi:hypothetical protein